MRELFLSFFVEKNHYRMSSFPLVPQDDKSLLLINSVMAPLKKYFLGQAKVPGNRATTCQKCIRTPDIERVGKTSRHGTFFEMLGNFSFGDYFKKEACEWAWEFLTDRVGMDPDRLFCSVFLDDDEAYDIWTKVVGVAESHMIRLGREDNFWEIGSGPCGPCSEIYYDRGAENGCGSPDCAPGCDCDRYVEIWNLVFTQFISDGNGNYTKMEKPNIDTGMGLERLGCMVQNVANLFEVDTIQNIMKHVERIAGVTYKENEQSDVSLRVITDHIRSTVFMVGDGVAPTNEGRGYVLRRLLRRAARHGRLLGIDRLFLYEVCETVIDENRTAYPELDEHRAYIVKVIRAEEERFEKTINAGLLQLQQAVDDMVAQKTTIMPGDTAFKLNDTYGFPIDLILEILEEQGYSVDMDGYTALMNEQRMRAREDAKKKDVSWENDIFRGLDLKETEFIGYGAFSTEAVIQFLAVDGARAETASEGDSVLVILDKTPFYAESGGQVGDRGTIRTANACIAVEDCQKTSEGYFIHRGTVESGVLETGERVIASLDSDIRRATMRNHTSAHLLHQALREVLGDHVHQAGSYVDADRVRFDFSHFEAMKPEELRRVEQLVNQKILEALPVAHKTMPIEQAKKEGAIALFGEKYGDVVRVIDVTGFSVEFCGGTHVTNTAELGLFKILSESSVAAGIRRVEGTTGFGVLSYIDHKQKVLNEVASIFRVGGDSELAAKARAVQTQLSEAEKTIEGLRDKAANESVDELLNTKEVVNGISLYSGRIDVPVETLRKIAISARDRDALSVAVLASVQDDKVTFCAAVGTEAMARGLRAGDIVKAVSAVAGGSGGGKPEIAMAGAKEIGKIPEALKAAREIIEQQKQEG